MYDDYKTGKELVKKENGNTEIYRGDTKKHREKEVCSSFSLCVPLLLLCETPCNIFSQFSATFEKWVRNGG